MMLHGRLVPLALWVIMTLFTPPSAWSAAPLESVLPNGLRVIVVPEPKAPVVTVQVWYRVGSRDEVSGKTGLSHLMEHMMFKGTARYGKGEFSRLVAAHGGNDNAFTSQDYTAYFENLASNQVDLALELEADRMTGLAIADAEFALERDVVKEERRLRTDDDPQGTLTEHLYAAAFLAHPYRWPVIGWMDDLNRLTADDIRAYYQRHYHPANATLVVVGNVDVKALLGRIERVFGPVEGGPRPLREARVEPPQRGERRVVVKKAAQLPVVVLGFKTPNYRHPDAYPLTVLAALLAEGKSSRLYRNLVSERQLAVEAGGDYSALSADDPLFYIYGVAHPTTLAADLEHGLMAELDRLKAAPPEPRELAKAKNQIEAQFLLGQDSNFVRGMQIGTAETVGAGRGYLNDFVAKIRTVTAEDIVRVTKAYFVEDARTVATLVPTAASTPGTVP
jgi:zinc protease